MEKYFKFGRDKLTSTPKSDLRETEPKRRRFESPVTSKNEKYSGLVPITPMPDYDAIDTPEIQRQAQKYGIKKNIGKKKLRMKLKEVYMYTHQTASPDVSRKDEDAGESLQKGDQNEDDSSPVKDSIKDDSDVVFLDMSDVHQMSSSFSKDENLESPRVTTCDPTSQNIEVISLLDSDNENSFSKNQKDVCDKNKDLYCQSHVTCDVTINSDIPVPHLEDHLPVFDVNKNKKMSTNLHCTNVSNFISEEGNPQTQEHGNPLTNEWGITLSPHKLNSNNNTSSEVISLLDESEIQEEEKDKEENKEKERKDDDIIKGQAVLSGFEKENTLNSIISPESKNIQSSIMDENFSTNKEEISCQDIFEDFPDEEKDSLSDEEKREELHRSLFVSIHQDEKDSDSESSSEDDSECMSLMQRLMQQKKLNTQNSVDENVGKSEDAQIFDEIITKKTVVPLESKNKEKEVNSPVCDVTEKCRNFSQSQKKVDYFTEKSTDNKISDEQGTKTKNVRKKKVKLDGNELNLAIYNAICSNDKIYDSVLQYKPVYLSQFKKLMDDEGIKVSANSLLDFLDSEGITFSTADENKGKTRLKKRK